MTILGVNEDAIGDGLGPLLAHGLVRAVPTGPDAELVLLSATAARAKIQVSSLHADRHLMPSVIIRYVESAEEDAAQRARRLPDRASRDLAAALLDASDGPEHGVALTNLTEFIRAVFPRLTMNAKGSSDPGEAWEIPPQLLTSISRVTPVESDSSKPCPVRGYFAVAPFLAHGRFGRRLIELLRANQLRVAEFQAISEEQVGPFGPIFRVSRERANADGEHARTASTHGNAATRRRRHRPDSGAKLKSGAKRTFVLDFLKECRGWDGTLIELSAELKSRKRLSVSPSTLSRYLKRTKYDRKGSPRKAAKGKGQTEAVSGDLGPASLRDLDAWVMPDDTNDAIS